MGFVVVVFGMLFARYSHLAFPHLPWEIYYGLPALTTVLLPPPCATRTKETYLHAQYLRIRSRRGAKKAIGAVAASILAAAFHMLKNGTPSTRTSAQTTSTSAHAQGNHVLQREALKEPWFRRPDHAHGGLINALFLVKMSFRFIRSRAGNSSGRSVDH
ncbi:MAG TPA: hypothetical protein VNO32_20365 [Candidatus Acidoferrum sp.]|nr:hypothetical protein [Candidatus Acidoferrum sp.]